MHIFCYRLKNLSEINVRNATLRFNHYFVTIAKLEQNASNNFPTLTAWNLSSAAGALAFSWYLPSLYLTKQTPPGNKQNAWIGAFRLKLKTRPGGLLVWHNYMSQEMEQRKTEKVSKVGGGLGAQLREAERISSYRNIPFSAISGAHTDETHSINFTPNCPLKLPETWGTTCLKFSCSCKVVIYIHVKMVIGIAHLNAASIKITTAQVIEQQRY